MIPNKLRLQNFMCYRSEQSLDFAGIHLACLAGDNGHGKSTLLDAITWALWGRARARRDDELITLGESEMWVEFEFSLGFQKYRVWRQRSKRGRGQSDLHFYVWSDATNEWQLLDAGNLNERQAQITHTLRMEYDTFTNSAFLMQGRADSFTIKTPGDRKQILADILGLDHYDLYEERAKEEGRKRKDQAERVQGEMDGIDRELSHRAAYEAKLKEARLAVQAAGLALRTAEAEQGQARMALQNLENQERLLHDLRTRLQRAERDLNEARTQLAAAQAKLREYEEVLGHRAEIEAGWQTLQETRAQDAAFNEGLAQYSALQEQIAQVRMAINAARLEVEAELRQTEVRRRELGARIALGREQEAALAQIRPLLARFAEADTRREALQAKLREGSERAGVLKAENERARVEGQGIADKLELLRAPASAACPLCRQPLTNEHRDEMLATLGAEREALATTYRANQAELKALQQEHQALESEDAELGRELKARDARQGQAARAEAAINDAETAAGELAIAEQKALELGRAIEGAHYAPREQAQLAELQSQLATIGYDAETHRAIKAEIQRWQPYELKYQRQLLAALEGVDEARSRVELLAAQIARREAELAEDAAQSRSLEATVAGLPRLREALARADATVRVAQDEERRARQEEGAAMQQLKALETLVERRQDLDAELDRLNDEISLYNQLREAFGKKGLQAMIIESAIPEIEAEANRLLGRMTEGRMNLRLETQREKMTGGLTETLDIIISDELGPRPYEMYSGGEAFRANLALRIAVSKLLARRAGAQLQTLVIDEGFGTQDSQGRALLVDAINSIQNDFERVLVVTHIDELKDLFPARIDVVKTAHGSHVNVV